jgi:hypothetical protein
MPKAPTGMEPSKINPKLGDEEAPARRSERRTTPDSPSPGPDGEMAPAGLKRPGAAKAPPDHSMEPGKPSDPG